MRATWTEPMLATPSGPGAQSIPGPADQWLVERKLDGLRTIVVRDGDELALWSRNHRSFTERFPGIVAALRALPATSFVLDGEIVAFEGERTSFGLLQRREPGTVPVLCAFDLLALLGHDTTGLDVPARRALLRELLDGARATASGEVLRIVEVLEGDPATLLASACAGGWEGLVAKRRSSRYRSGRSPDWRKLKCRASQELVIGGWTDPSGTRTGLGALLVGYYDDPGTAAAGGLRFAGRVGTGFDERTLGILRATLGPLETPASPFVDQLRLPGAHWVRPELVAAVVFSEWTHDGRLRHPSFDGLRDDKEAGEVRREPR